MCEAVEGNFGPQVKLQFENGDLLFLPADSAHRQLLHAGFADVGDDNNPRADLHAVAGNTLSVFRTPNKKSGSAPYWNVTIPTGAPPAPSKRLAGPDTATVVPGAAPKAAAPASHSTTTSAMSKALTAHPTRSRAQVAAAYAWALATAHAAQVATLGSTTPDAVQAGAATLLIQIERSGLLFVDALAAQQPLNNVVRPLTAVALDVTPPSRYEEPLPPEPDEDFLPF
jgi:hypothetical protein